MAIHLLSRVSMACWLGWAARLISGAAVGFWLLIFLQLVACDALVGFVCVNWEMALLAGMAFTSLACVLLAWRNARIGGVVMISWGVLFAAIALLTSSPYQILSVGVTGAPFVLAGIIFLASDGSRRDIASK